MAKIIEAPVDEQTKQETKVDNPSEKVDNPAEGSEDPETAPDDTKSGGNEEKSTKKKKSDEEEATKDADTIDIVADESQMNANVKKSLKLFSNYEKLYVNSVGGVFTEDTKLPAGEAAILYQNPYYKKQ